MNILRGGEMSTSGKAITSLVLGICGWVLPVVGVVCSILAIIFGILARNEIRSSEGKLSGEGMALAGFILGVTGLAVNVGVWLFVWKLIVEIIRATLTVSSTCL